LDNLPKTFDPAKKDEVIATLIGHYGWGNNDSFIQNMATTFVNLLVQYPGCLPELETQQQQTCTGDQFKTIYSLLKGISKYRCNVDPPIASEVPPTEVPQNEAPLGELP
jgi:hypothetical protein